MHHALNATVFIVAFIGSGMEILINGIFVPLVLSQLMGRFLSE